MNNEPVAWMGGNQKALAWVKEALVNPIPLYTHPAKTLTDEEIQWMIDNFVGEEGRDWVFQFAKAILRKVNEK